MNSEKQDRLLDFLAEIAEHQPQLVATLQSIDRHLDLITERLDLIEERMSDIFEALPDPGEEEGGAMTSWQSPGRAAISALVEDSDMRPSAARGAVETVFQHLIEPDRDMLEAGAAELALALPKEVKPNYARALAGVVWRAMIERARP